MLRCFADLPNGWPAHGCVRGHLEVHGMNANEPVVWKAYEEVHFNDQYILRWVREGDEYVNKITKEMMEDLKSVVRQQQAEIEALKAAKIRAYNNGVEDGRKPDTNNKPVAWMETYKGEPNNLDWDKSNLNYGSEFHDVVPLYTHPVKEITLTNEEILEYADAYGLGIGNIYEFGHGQFIAVIRAILRKAQEK